jgi:hypothetical protein
MAAGSTGCEERRHDRIVRSNSRQGGPSAHAPAAENGAAFHAVMAKGLAQPLHSLINVMDGTAGEAARHSHESPPGHP